MSAPSNIGFPAGFPAGFPGGSAAKNLSANAEDAGDPIPTRVGKILSSRKWQLTPVLA